jgi:hypothetical protein
VVAGCLGIDRILLDGQVMTQDLANGNVTTVKIKDGEVKSADIGNLEVKHEDIAHGTIVLFSFPHIGPQIGSIVIPVGGDGVATAFCSGESVLTGGGYEVLSGTLEVRGERHHCAIHCKPIKFLLAAKHLS